MGAREVSLEGFVHQPARRNRHPEGNAASNSSSGRCPGRIIVGEVRHEECLDVDLNIRYPVNPDETCHEVGPVARTRWREGADG
jgi:hypothetical protein